MSWASENPELYDEICEKGVLKKLKKSTPRYCTTDKKIEEIFDIIFGDQKFYAIQCALHDWSWKEITEEEQDYWGTQADIVMDLRKDMEIKEELNRRK